MVLVSCLLQVHVSVLSYFVQCMQDTVDLAVAECFLFPGQNHRLPSTQAVGRNGHSPGNMSEHDTHACTCMLHVYVRSCRGGALSNWPMKW